MLDNYTIYPYNQFNRVINYTKINKRKVKIIMKKLLVSVFAAVMALALGIFAAACSSSVEGTYKFSSMTITYEGKTETYEVGQEVEGEVLKDDYYVLTVNKDNTFTMTTTYEDETETMTGTWEEKDGKYVLSGKEGEYEYSFTMTLDGKTATLQFDEYTTFKFVK